MGVWVYGVLFQKGMTGCVVDTLPNNGIWLRSSVGTSDI